jgi:hypothetical protein
MTPGATASRIQEYIAALVLHQARPAFQIFRRYRVTGALTRRCGRPAP